VEVSAVGVAGLYRDFLDVMVIDRVDEGEAERVRALGLEVAVAETVMKSLEDKVELARGVLELGGL
jgi:LPPG:FO 2-phospho-L-lactate transferase